MGDRRAVARQAWTYRRDVDSKCADTAIAVSTDLPTTISTTTSIFATPLRTAASIAPTAAARTAPRAACSDHRANASATLRQIRAVAVDTPRRTRHFFRYPTHPSRNRLRFPSLYRRCYCATDSCISRATCRHAYNGESAAATITHLVACATGAVRDNLRSCDDSPFGIGWRFRLRGTAGTGTGIRHCDGQAGDAGGESDYNYCGWNRQSSNTRCEGC